MYDLREFCGFFFGEENFSGGWVESLIDLKVFFHIVYVFGGISVLRGYYTGKSVIDIYKFSDAYIWRRDMINISMCILRRCGTHFYSQKKISIANSV